MIDNIAMDDFGKILIKLGLLLIAAGAIALALKKFGLNIGRLPGDVHIEREGFSFAFPIVTCILVSLIVSVVLNFFFKSK